MTYHNGDVYEGEWKKVGPVSMPCGYGVYKGQFCAGIPQIYYDYHRNYYDFDPGGE